MVYTVNSFALILMKSLSSSKGRRTDLVYTAIRYGANKE